MLWRLSRAGGQEAKLLNKALSDLCGQGTRGVDPARAAAALQALGRQPIQTTLTGENAKKLREAAAIRQLNARIDPVDVAEAPARMVQTTLPDNYFGVPAVDCAAPFAPRSPGRVFKS